MLESLQRIFAYRASLVARVGKSRKRFRKFLRRLRDPERRRATAWCRKNATDLEAFARSLDSMLWDEALDAKRRIGTLRRTRLDSLALHGARAQDIGGGPGNLALLHWLVRLLRPRVVIETGVASGASSRAILEALFLNDTGRLLSSDLAGVVPREHAGLCVDPEMHSRWTLLHDGDRRNIPLLISEVESVDLLHYDSAKDPAEMQWVLEQITPLFSDRAVVVLDDVDRHSFMSEYVRRTNKSWHVFGAVGVIGLSEALAPSQSD